MKYLILISTFCWASTAAAQFNDLIHQFNGQITFLNNPPISMELDELVSDTLVYMFIEKTDHVLENDIVIDLSQPGFYFPNSIPKEQRTWEALNPGIIPAGTKVHSIYFHYDNETYNDSFNLFNYLNCIEQYQVNGKITFNFPVLGIIMRASSNQPNLLNSDAELGVPGVDYCEHNLTHFPGINIADGCQSDRFILSSDRKTLTIRNNTDIHHDNYRVILDASEITSVSNMNFKEPIKYYHYPNPTNDIIHFDIREQEILNFSISNQMGQRLESGNLTQSNQTISLVNFPSGIYFITLHSTALNSSTIKVVKY